MSSKSTFSNSTSNSYAVALYELAKENSELDKVEIEINSLYNLLVESSDFKAMILSPIVGKEEKRNVISAISEKNNFTKTLKKFLEFLTMKNRLFFLNKIIGSFMGFVSFNKGELKAKLISSKELSKKELEEIQTELSKDFQSSLKIEYSHDPSLIGGLVIQVGSIMVDTSIKSKLRHLEKDMIEV